MKQPQVWYTSDLHIGHNLVSRLRGFWADQPSATENAIPDSDAHDAQLAANWDHLVDEDDTVYVLGDISINGGQHALDWIEQRPGHKHLIIGNHDPVHPGIHHRKAAKLLPHWLQYFDTIQPFMVRKLLGRHVHLSHFPYTDWGDGEARPGTRFEQYRLPDLGAPLLHGHTHGTEVAHGHSYHVGLDAHQLTLVPQNTILEWLATLPQPEKAPVPALRE